MKTLHPLDASSAIPGEVRFIRDSWRIAKVVAITTSIPDEYETVLRWYLPITKKDKRLIKNFKDENCMDVVEVQKSL